MKRLFTLALFLTAFVASAGAAQAHPLGNFSINHLSSVRISEERIDVLYVLDEAEIPTLEQSDVAPSVLVRRKRAEVLDGLRLVVDGRRVRLRPDGPARLRQPPGQGGLRTTRLELPLIARTSDPRRVELRDETFTGRVGWKAIVAGPGDGTDVRSTAPSGDPTHALRRYPEDLLSSPLDRREARFAVEPGDGELVAPGAEGGRTSTTRSGGEGGFTGLFEDAASGEGVLVLLLLAAFGWGALHALSPGHGKAMVAAYLVGTRGKARHAVWLGVTVTITHTLGVFALGLVALLLSQYILPEDLYPWLTLVSGLLVVVIGVGVLRSRVRWAHGHDHSHAHGHSHPHTHDHDDVVTRRSLISMGAAAGLIPCPSALVVLLGAVAQHQVGLGLLLIVAFSVGLAGTLTAIGLGVVYARRLLPRGRLSGHAAAILPAASALLIVGVGCVLTAQAVPNLV